MTGPSPLSATKDLSPSKTSYRPSVTFLISPQLNFSFTSQLLPAVWILPGLGCSFRVFQSTILSPPPPCEHLDCTGLAPKWEVYKIDFIIFLTKDSASLQLLQVTDANIQKKQQVEMFFKAHRDRNNVFDTVTRPPTLFFFYYKKRIWYQFTDILMLGSDWRGCTGDAQAEGKLYSPLRQHLQIPCDELTAQRWTAIGRLNPSTYHTDSFIWVTVFCCLAEVTAG